jgi:NAD(P)-dependent dehydrogenase (short-subunit alcohol dehydrogenase family)
MLEGKRMIVTGGAGVLGSSVALIAEEQGAEVVLLDVVEKPETITGEYYAVDLLDQQEVEMCFKQIGDFDCLANIAGGFDMGPTVWESSEELWESMFSINVTTLRRVLSCAVPRMVESGGGSIVNVGALGALKASANMGAYSAAKSTVIRLTESLSEEVKKQGINVNAVLPSLIDTPRNRADMPDANFSEWVNPVDLAKVICFLASDGSRAVHGALVPVAGLV